MAGRGDSAPAEIRRGKATAVRESGGGTRGRREQPVGGPGEVRGGLWCAARGSSTSGEWELIGSGGPASKGRDCRVWEFQGTERHSFQGPVRVEEG
jgi:hypothetical protein